MQGIFHDGKTLEKVIVSPPNREYFKIEDLRAHNIKEIANIQKAKDQHKKLVETMRSTGTKVITVEELENHPNSVFTMDTALSLGDSFIRLRMGLPTRRGEESWMTNILKALDLEKICEIKAPGTAEGGDLIPAYPVFFVGLSSRTNIDGAHQVSKIVSSLGYEIRIIPVPKNHLHLGGAMTLIDEDRILACKSLPKDLLSGFEILWIDCKSFISGNVINLGKGKIIVESRNNEGKNVLEREGYEIFSLDLSEFIKGSGGPSCLILPLKRG